MHHQPRFASCDCRGTGFSIYFNIVTAYRSSSFETKYSTEMWGSCKQHERVHWNKVMRWPMRALLMLLRFVVERRKQSSRADFDNETLSIMFYFLWRLSVYMWVIQIFVHVKILFVNNSIKFPTTLSSADTSRRFEFFEWCSDQRWLESFRTRKNEKICRKQRSGYCKAPL